MRELEFDRRRATEDRHRNFQPRPLLIDLLDETTAGHGGGAERFAVRATDLGRLWSVGAEAPVVEGTAADLGWWLTGRGAGEGLSTDGGRLPRLGR